ncbi:hypothetical protein KIN20_037527 [Parelaphostrongylus tenuis]|uniref:Uncharacterized protein n=1 Tax=Parelaphostrongylus tenuis TaxID=148309 RepID=A0AAD5WM60_PARTN|nr:hypothetical protein KIN20_037527 [Parelaphostrongylus tenuis]
MTVVNKLHQFDTVYKVHRQNPNELDPLSESHLRFLDVGIPEESTDSGNYALSAGGSQSCDDNEDQYHLNE